MSRILMPEYLLNFARDIYEGPLPSDFGERLIDRKDVQVLENWYKLFGGKIQTNQGKRMVPRYLLLFIQKLANAEILEVVDDDVAYIKETPQNALKYAFLNKVGGMCYTGDFEGIRESLVTSVNNTTLTANEAKYGWGLNEELYNYRDYDENKGHLVVDKILGIDYNDISILITSAGLKCVVIQTDISFTDNDSTILAEINNLGLTTLSASSQWSTTLTNVITFNRSKRIVINFDQTLSNEEMIDKAKTLVVYYKQMTETIEDINPIDNIIDVSNNVTFNNEYEQAVPSEITYYVRS